MSVVCPNMANFEEKSDENAVWPSEIKQYQWKGTISEGDDTWYVLAHCRPRKQDVFIKIRCVKGDDSLDQFTKITTKLINIRHPHLMTPVHAFVIKSEIYVIYPRHSGGYGSFSILSFHSECELLDGIPNESNYSQNRKRSVCV